MYRQLRLRQTPTAIPLNQIVCELVWTPCGPARLYGERPFKGQSRPPYGVLTFRYTWEFSIPAIDFGALSTGYGPTCCDLSVLCQQAQDRTTRRNPLPSILS